MKKNLRIVSAAAAALLAVAPVAATAVSTVSASAQTTPVTKVQNGLNYDAVVNKNDAWVFTRDENGDWHHPENATLAEKAKIQVTNSDVTMTKFWANKLGLDWAKGNVNLYKIVSGEYAGSYILQSDVHVLKQHNVVNGQDLPAGAYFSYEGRDYATGDTIYLNPTDSQMFMM